MADSSIEPSWLSFDSRQWMSYRDGSGNGPCFFCLETGMHVMFKFEDSRSCKVTSIGFYRPVAWQDKSLQLEQVLSLIVSDSSFKNPCSQDWLELMNDRFDIKLDKFGEREVNFKSKSEWRHR